MEVTIYPDFSLSVMSKWLCLEERRRQESESVPGTSARGGNSAPPTELVRLGHDYWNGKDYASAKRRAQSQHSP